jgi:hypothetical protein
MRIAPALEGLVDRLRVAGFVADVDPSRLDVNPCAVWVQPRELRDMRQTLHVWLYLIVGGGETDRVLELLDDALEGVLELLGPLPDDDDVIDLAAPIVLPTGPNPLPAYRVAVDLDL